MSPRSDAKSTSHGKNARPHDLMCLESTFFRTEGYVLPSRGYPLVEIMACTADETQKGRNSRSVLRMTHVGVSQFF